MAAALVHDLGHGPFSHAFESASEYFGNKSHHEEWTTAIVTGATGINRVLEKFRKGFSAEVADLISAETPADIYASIVSSQFDADRLDYMRRDRMMTGVVHGAFDFSWLMANLEVGTVPLTIDDEVIGEVDALILNTQSLASSRILCSWFVSPVFYGLLPQGYPRGRKNADSPITAGRRIDKGRQRPPDRASRQFAIVQLHQVRKPV